MCFIIFVAKLREILRKTTRSFLAFFRECSRFSVFSRTAFTAVELIVSLGVVTLLTALLILYNRTGHNQLVLFAERARVLGTITEAKAKTIETFAQTDPPCGYGVRIQPLRGVTLFRNNLPSGSPTTPNTCEWVKAGNGGVGHLYNASRDTPVETYQISFEVGFVSTRTILFIPPDPTTRFIAPAGGDLDVVLETIDGNASAEIRINEFGQITI